MSARLIVTPNPTHCLRKAQKKNKEVVCTLPRKKCHACCVDHQTMQAESEQFECVGEDESVTVLSYEQRSDPGEESVAYVDRGADVTIFPQQQTLSLVREFFNRQRTEVGSLYKTRMCIYAINNAAHTCPNGSNCNFAHSFLELKNRPDLTKTALCKFVKIGNNVVQCNRSNCKYAHSLAELRVDPRYAEAFHTSLNASGGNNSFGMLGASPPHLHTIKRISDNTFVTTCEFCGKFCRITPRLQSGPSFAPPHQQ